MILLGDAGFVIRAVLDHFHDDMNRARDEVKKSSQVVSQDTQKMANKVSIAGGVIVGTMAMAARSYINQGAKLVDLARETNLSVEQLERLSFAAEQNGMAMADMRRGIGRMNMAVQGWIDSGEEGNETLDRMGVSIDDLMGRDPHGQFLLIAQAISQLGTHGERTSAATEIFGRNLGRRMLPMLSLGEEGIRALGDEMEELGIGMGTDGANAAADLAGEIDKLNAQVNQVWLEVGGALVPVLKNDLVPAIQETLGTILNWVQRNPDFVAALVKFATGLGAIALAARPLITTLKTVAALKGIVAALGLGPAGLILLAGAGISLGVIAALGGFSGGGGGDQTTKELENALSSANELGVEIPAAARGGFHSGWTLVGEEGPELVNLGNRGGMIYTAGQTEGIMGFASKGGFQLNADLRGAYIRDPKDLESLSEDMGELMDNMRVRQGFA